jgi:hypothetical protein
MVDQFSDYLNQVVLDEKDLSTGEESMEVC